MGAPTVSFAEPGSKADLEEGAAATPRFGPDGLIVCVATDAATGDVLMVAHMNAEALARTVETGEAWYWSRSRGELWRKGATSGQVQNVGEMRIDCDRTPSGSRSASAATVAAVIRAAAHASTAWFPSAGSREKPLLQVVPSR